MFSNYNIKYATDKERAGFAYVGEEHYRGLFNLVNHEDRQNTQSRMTFMIRSVVLLKCLMQAGYFGQSDALPGKDELLIGRLLYRFQMGIQYNLHSVYQVSGAIEAGKKIPLEDIGAGVYPTTIFFNHSCAPNTVRINQGPRVSTT